MGKEAIDRLRAENRSTDPVIDAYKIDVDRSLLRENLKRTPTERLENLQALQIFAEELRQAGAGRRKPE